MKLAYFSIFLVVTFFISLNGHADIFKWVDEHGRTHFGDKPPEKNNAEQITVNVNTYTSVSYESMSSDTGGQLLVYTKDSCGYCQKAKAYLDKNGTPYVERNLDHSRLARKQFERLNATGVPVFLKGKERMNGYSQKRLESFLAMD